MYKETAIQSLFNGIIIFVGAIATIMTAQFLSPSDFGLYAATQSIAIMLIPLATLRIETRIAICTSDKQLSHLLSAVATSVLLFVIIGFIATPVLGFFFAWKMVLAVILLAASAAMVETLISVHAYKGDVKKIIKYRAVKQIFPAMMVLFAAYLFKDLQFVIAALVMSFVVCVIILYLSMKHNVALSKKILRNTISEYSTELRASLLLGSLNAVWSNGLLPLMSAMGLSSIAGQYAIAQRLINIPLGVIGISVQFTLLKSGNQFHKDARSIFDKVFMLFIIAILQAGTIYWLIYIQSIISFPDQWKLDKLLFFATSFFLSCSFSIGTVSILGIRLKDEWFLTYWQLTFILIWVSILLFFDSNRAFIYMLFIGGVGYWILFVRWLILSRRAT